MLSNLSLKNLFLSKRFHVGIIIEALTTGISNYWHGIYICLSDTDFTSFNENAMF